MRRNLRLFCMLGTLSLLPSCARILHPERVGNHGGRVDVVPLVVDILLFIPGLVPGLIAIIVDFGTGAIYVQNGDGSLTESGDRLALRTLPNGSNVVVFESDEGEPIAYAPVSRTQQGQTIELMPIPTQTRLALR